MQGHPFTPFTIWKGCFSFQEADAYIITAGGFYHSNIYAEGYLLIVRPEHDPALLYLEPAHFPKDVGFELPGLLKAQFEFGRDKLAKWFLDQIGYQGYAYLRQIEWESISDPEDLVGLLKADKRILGKFEEILKDSNCVELEQFIGKVCDLAAVETVIGGI
jgi:hypothetical protein